MNLKEDSGNVKIKDKLTSFLYELMRDYVTPGKVQELLQNSSDEETEYTNGYLARYAEYLSKELKCQK